MIVAASATDLAVLITAGAAAIGVLCASAVSLITAIAAARQVSAATYERAQLASTMEAVHQGVAKVASELVTLNGSTVGQLADADETRRVEAIAPEDRTAAEDEHIAVVPPDGGASKATRSSGGRRPKDPG